MANNLHTLQAERSSLLENQLDDAGAARLAELDDKIAAAKEQLEYTDERREMAQEYVAQEREYRDELAAEKSEVLAESSASERTEEQQAVIDQANNEQNRYEEAVQWGDERYFAVVDDNHEVKCVPEHEYNEWRNDRQLEAFQDVSTGAELKEACESYKHDVDDLQHDMFQHIEEVKAMPGDHQQELDACRNTILDGMDQKDDLKAIEKQADYAPDMPVEIPVDAENILADMQSRMDQLDMEMSQIDDQIAGNEIEMER